MQKKKRKRWKDLKTIKEIIKKIKRKIIKWRNKENINIYKKNKYKDDKILNEISKLIKKILKKLTKKK